MNEKKVLEALRTDLDDARKVKDTVDVYISRMRNIYEGRTEEKKERGSNYISREAFKQIEWVKAQLKNPFISNDTIARLNPDGRSDRDFSIQTEKLINFYYTKKFDRYNYTTDAFSVLLIEGTLVTRTGWDYLGEETEIEVPITDVDANGQPIVIGSTQVTKEIPIINNPTATVVKNEDIFIDPTANEQDDIQFVIHRREVRLSDLKRKEHIYKNLDKVEENSRDGNSNYSYAATYDQNLNPNNNVNIEGKKEKLYMYEYWGNIEDPETGEVKPMVCCWIGDVIIRLDDNPYNDQKIPYIVTQCIKEPFSIWGKSYVELLENHQKVMTGITRGILDDIAQSNSKQLGIQKGNLDPVNLKKYINNEVFEFNLSPNAFYQGQYNRIPSEVFKTLQDFQADAQVTTGVVPFQGGQGTQSIYGSQAGKAGQMNSMMLRELDMVINIADNLIKPMLRKWVEYIYDLLEPEEIEEITEMPYVEPPKGIDKAFYKDFTIDISTQQTDEVKASELAFLLQTLGNNMPFEMTQLLMSEIARLKKMPDLAASVKGYQPQPDPFEQQMKQLELQKLQLELQLMGQEAQAEVSLKTAKAKEAGAKADAVTQGSINTKYGVDFNQKIQELNAKHQMELEKLREQARLKAQGTLPNNIGIPKQDQKPMPQDNLTV